MKVGDIVKRHPVTLFESDKGEAPRKAMTGKVIYIHPRGRYHTVEFELPGGKMRESFLGAGDH